MKTFGLLALTIGILAAVAVPAQAQQIRTNAREKVKWFNAPHEIQIIDDRPVVKDFREAPSTPQSIQLPPGPMGGGGVGGGGAGALGGDSGGTLPAGGMPIGGGGPGYRTGNGNSLPLPKADFGHAVSNIPARGMGPKGPLPGGQTTGIHGKVGPWATSSPQAGPAMGRGYGGRPVAATPAATYGTPGGGYGPSVGGGSGYGNGGANASVTGRLLHARVK